MSHEPPLTSRLRPSDPIAPGLKTGDVASGDLSRTYAWQVAGNLLVSFRYAWAGISYAFTTQRNFRVHTLVATIALSLSWYLGLQPVEVAVIGLTIAAVMALELVNTALESVVDLTVKQTYHELAKVAKDCAAGAVLIASIAAVVIAALLLLPPLFTRLHLI